MPLENLILAALTEGEQQAVRDLVEVRPLQIHEPLQRAGDATNFVYFPTSGIISVLTVLQNGMSIECATIGREGTTGVPLSLGVSNSNSALISQVPGFALRMNSADFLALLASSPTFAALLLSYSGVMLGLVAQSAACNRGHHVDARCARWLLMTHDQVDGNTFPTTHEFMAQVLGVTRSSVSVSLSLLQSAGLISYHRGMVTILHRSQLEASACECYAVTNQQLRKFRESPLVTGRLRRSAGSGGAK